MHSAPLRSSDPDLLCAPEDKKTLELRNQASVFRYVTSFFDHDPERNPYTRGTILELHSMTIEGIFPCAGSFRDATSDVVVGGASFSPPPAYRIEATLAEILSDATDICRPMRGNAGLWEQVEQIGAIFHRFEALHPFMGGNGRVERALLLLALYDHRLLAPPDEIFGYVARRRGHCLAALEAADGEDTDPLTSFLYRGVLDSSVQRLIRVYDELVRRFGHPGSLADPIMAFRHPSTRARLSDATFLERLDTFIDASNAVQSWADTQAQ